MIELPLMSFFPSEFETNKQTDSQIRYIEKRNLKRKRFRTQIYGLENHLIKHLQWSDSIINGRQKNT